MKNVFLSLIILFAFSVNGQEVKNPMEDLQTAYEDAMDDYEVFDNCGSGLDGMAAMTRNLENKVLDASISLTLEQEYQIGLAYREKLAEEKEFVHNYMLENQLSKMLIDTVIAPYVKRKGVQYSLTIVDDPVPNAFATNGGFIYLTTGLLGFIQSPDELAFIVAHEITHIDLEHVSRMVKRTLLLKELSTEYNAEDYEEQLIEITNKVYLPFGQVDEYEADRNAFLMARAAGFNPEKFADFFKRVLENYGEEKDDWDKFSRSHPYMSDRINCINYYLENL